MKNNDYRSAIAKLSGTVGHLVKCKKPEVLASVQGYHHIILQEAIKIEPLIWTGRMD